MSVLHVALVEKSLLLCVMCVQGESGEVDEIHVVMEKLSETGRKPRAFIHWLSNPLPCQVRLYQNLYVPQSQPTNQQFCLCIYGETLSSKGHFSKNQIYRDDSE